MVFNNLGLSDSFFFLVKNDPRYRSKGMTVRDVSYETNSKNLIQLHRICILVQKRTRLQVPFKAVSTE